MRATLSLAAVAALILSSVSCSTGPSGPEPGTAAYYWSAANTSFAQGDHLKTTENLERAMKSAEYKAQALPWMLVVTSGLARGYMDVADAFEQGAKASKTDASVFRTQMIDNRKYARNFAIQFAQYFRDFTTSNTDEQVKLAFPFPPGSPSEPPMLARITSGMMPDEPIRASIVRSMLQRGVILEVARAVGAGDDASKAQAMFKASEVAAPRTQFMLGMAGALYDQAQLFGPNKLDDPTKMRLFAEEALDALKPVPSSKEVKGLNDKIQKSLKDVKSRMG